MESLLDFTRNDLVKWLEQQGIKPFRANQIFKWVYLKQAVDFNQMTDLGQDVRAHLSRSFSLSSLELQKRQVSRDGTEKFLYRLSDGRHIESVLIPEKDHYTLCVSSQAGCAMNCRFCLTATGGWERNLTPGEIIAQVRDVRQYLGAKGIDPQRLSNIVFMGMGEPLANYDALIKAIYVLTDTDFGMKFSGRRVTVSTCGLVPELLRLGQDTDVNLAVSLNATEDALRTWLMPVNRRYPLDVLLDACRKFSMKPRNKITFEYILIRAVNDTPGDARRLVKLLAGIRAKINLIAFNPHDGSEMKPPDSEVIEAFLQILLDRNMTAIVRKSKGADILAACGQLRAEGVLSRS